QEQVLRLIFVAKVEKRPATLEMETLDARVEIDQADGHACDAHDRQSGLVALALDEPALLDVDVQRVGEDVDGIEADLLGHLDAEGGALAGLCPRRVDQS